MTRSARPACTVILLLGVQAGAAAQQFADPEFDAKVDRPAFTDRHPLVLVDEAHNNFHTADGRYKPFADLLKNDGYSVTAEQAEVHGRGAQGLRDPRGVERPGSAADEKPGGGEPRVQRGRVRCRSRLGPGGGLAPADRRPSSLGSVERAYWQRGSASRWARARRSTRPMPRPGLPAQLNFSRVNGLLGDHPILTGRDGSERIDRVAHVHRPVAQGARRLGRAAQALARRPSTSRVPPSRAAMDQPPAVPGAGLHTGTGQSRRPGRGRDALGAGQRPPGSADGDERPGQ